MGFVNNLLMIVLLFTALFLIVLILIQRGKGGGLAGAFGGMGGQSAFGTKAGDMFTKITIGVATFWIVLCIIMVKLSGVGGGPLSQDMGGAESTPGVNAAAPADKKPAGEKAGDKTEAPAETPAKGESK